MLVFIDCQASAVSAVVEALSVANLHRRLTNPHPRPPFAWRRVSLDGQPKPRTADRGRRPEHAFCPTCGSPIYATSAVDPRVYGLRVGLIHQR